MPPSPIKRVAFTYPDTFIPVVVITATLLVPPILILILPLALGIVTLLLPLTIETAVAADMPVKYEPLPTKKFAVAALPKFAFPAVILLETEIKLALAKFPRLVLPNVALEVIVSPPNVKLATLSVMYGSIFTRDIYFYTIYYSIYLKRKSMLD